MALDVPALGPERHARRGGPAWSREARAPPRPRAARSRSGSPSPSRAWSAASTASPPTRPTSAGTTSPVLDGLRARVDLDCPIRVENDANLSAIAEWAMGAEARTPDLVYLTGEVGVGGGRHRRRPAAARRRRAVRRGRAHRPRRPRPGLRLRPARLLGDRRRPGRAAARRRRPRRPGARPRPRPRDPAGGDRRAAPTPATAHPGRARPRSARRWAPAPPSSSTCSTRRSSLLGGYFAVLGRFLARADDRRAARRGSSAPTWPARGSSCPPSGFTAAVRGGAHVALESVFDDPTLVPASDDLRPQRLTAGS